MSKSTRLFAVAAVLAITGAVLPPIGASASHGGNVTVQVGQFFGVGPNCNQDTFEGCRGAESMRFLAPAVRVHRGDVVTFDIQGFHTATLLPRPTDFLDWAGKNTGGVGKPYSIWGPDTDDTAIDAGGSTSTPSLKANPKAAFPSHSGCGESAANPCVYDGNSIVNSGVPTSAPTFSMRIDVAPDPNTPVWAMCLVHPHMFMRILVVPDDQATTTQAEIDADEAAKVATDMEWAQSTDAEMIKAKGSHKTNEGKKVWDVYAGIDNHWATLYGFYPKKLTIDKGQSVRFHFTAGIYEVHTATFTYEQALQEFDKFFVPLCDPDGDSGAGPDTPAGEGPPCGGDFSKVELDGEPMAFYPQGDGVFGGKDYENSGVRGASPLGAAPRIDPWDLKFTKKNADGYRYMCVIHGGLMTGRITVK